MSNSYLKLKIIHLRLGVSLSISNIHSIDRKELHLVAIGNYNFKPSTRKSLTEITDWWVESKEKP